MADEADELIARVTETLKPLPDVSTAAKAAVLVAIAAERQRDRERASRRGVSRWVAFAGGLAAAALVAAVWMRASTGTPLTDAAPMAAVAPSASSAATLAAHDAGDAAAAQPVQLVFRAPAATRVRVVGDFTGWDAGAEPMTRDPASGLWSVTLAIRPGRHVYAFLVDDSLWVRDPRAPAAADADFQRPGSLLLVGRP